MADTSSKVSTLVSSSRQVTLDTIGQSKASFLSSVTSEWPGLKTLIPPTLSRYKAEFPSFALVTDKWVKPFFQYCVTLFFCIAQSELPSFDGWDTNYKSHDVSSRERASERASERKKISFATFYGSYNLITGVLGCVSTGRSQMGKRAFSPSPPLWVHLHSQHIFRSECGQMCLLWWCWNSRACMTHFFSPSA